MHLLYDIAVRTWALSQYPKRRLSVRSRKVSKPRDLYLKLSDRSEIWQALRQHCCRCACQISKRYDNLKYQSRGFETSRDLTKRRLFGYWDGAQVVKKMFCAIFSPNVCVGRPVIVQEVIWRCETRSCCQEPCVCDSGHHSEHGCGELTPWVPQHRCH